MEGDGIVIPFSFPQDPNVGQLLASIKKLKEETSSLSLEISKMPIDELRAKYQQWLTVLSNIQIETGKTNQSNKQHQVLLAKNADIVSGLVDKLQQNIDLQRLFNLEGEKQQKTLDGINKATLKAIESLSALNQKEIEGEKLTTAQVNAKIKYGETIKKNTDLITLFNAQLKEHSVHLKESSEQTELIAGHIALLEGLLKSITLEWKNLDESELKNADTNKYYSETIGAINAELNKYKVQISGTLELETQLNKTREQNIILENKTIALGEVDIDIKAKQIIAQNELNASIQNRVNILTTGFTTEELAAQKNAAIQEAADAKIIAANEKMLLSAQKAEVAQVNAAVKSAEAHEKSANKSYWSWENVTNQFNRMGVRMIASLAWFFAIMAVLGAIWEKITGTDEATKKLEKTASDAEKAFQSMSNEIESAFDTEYRSTTQLIDSVNNLNESYQHRIDSVEKLLKLYPELLDQMTAEDILAGKLTRDSDDKNFWSVTNQKMRAIEDVSADIAGYTKGLKDAQTDLAAKRAEEITLIKKSDKKGDPWWQTLNPFGTTNSQDAAQASRDREVAEDLVKNLTDKLDEAQSKFIALKYPKNSKRSVKDLKAELTLLKTEIDTRDLPQDIIDLIEGKTDDPKATKLRSLLKDKGLEGRDKETEELRDRYKSLETSIKILEGQQDPKGSHKKDRSFQTDLADAKIRHQTNLSGFQDEFDLSPQGLTDMKQLHQERIDEESRYQKELDFIWKNESTSAGLTAKELKRIKDGEIKDFAQDKKARDKQNEEYIFALKKYYEELDKVIAQGQEAIIRTKVEIERSSSEDKYARSVSKRKIKAIKRFNPFTAFFGGSGGQSKDQDYKDALANNLDNERRANEEAGVSGANLFRKNQDIDADKIKLGNDNLNLDLTSKEGRDTIKNDNEKLTKDLQERATIQKDYDEKSLVAKKAGEDTIKTEEQKAKEDKIEIAKVSFAALEKISNAAFDLQKKRIRAQMDNLQNLADFEMKLAGNNSGAKMRIAETTHRHMLELKRKEAQAEKTQAVFSAFVNMGKGIAESMSYGGIVGPILAAIVVAADLLAISQIVQQPLPQYRKGKRSGEGVTGLARVGEEGFEIAIGSRGARILKDGIAPVYKDETIFTHKESKELIQKDSFLETLLKGTGVISQREYLEKKERHTSIQQSISKDDFRDAMKEAIKDIPRSDYQAPAQDVQDRHIRQQLRNGL